MKAQIFAFILALYINPFTCYERIVRLLSTRVERFSLVIVYILPKYISSYLIGLDVYLLLYNFIAVKLIAQYVSHCMVSWNFFH
jgi:hypothetical protein